MNRQNLTTILKYAKRLAPIPNVPYLYQPVFQEIVTILEELGIDHKSNATNFHHGVWDSDEYALYIYFQRGKATSPLIIDSHLDHPGFVGTGKDSALALGSVGFKRINQLLQTDKLDINVYNEQGHKISNGILDSPITNSRRPLYTVKSDCEIKPNYHIQWALPEFGISDSNIFMYSADNMIVTDIALAIIEDIVANPIKYKDLNVMFIFTFLEEVFEISASGIASRRKTPFMKLDDSSTIIVLECMQLVPLLKKDTDFQLKRDLSRFRVLDDNFSYEKSSRKEYESSEHVHSLYNLFGVQLPNYYDGPLIKINDVDCVYGLHFPSASNRAEDMLVQTALDLKIKFQHTISGGACNGTAFSLFPITSNIASVVVPNPWKHNMDEQGRLVSEKVNIADISSVYSLITEVITRYVDLEHVSPHEQSMSKQLKTTISIPADILKKMKSEREWLAWRAKPQLSSGIFFPEKVIDSFRITSRSVTSKFRELLKIHL